MIQCVNNPVTETDKCEMGSEASHEVIFILFSAFIANYCSQNNAVKNKVSIRIIYLHLCLFL